MPAATTRIADELADDHPQPVRVAQHERPERAARELGGDERDERDEHEEADERRTDGERLGAAAGAGELGERRAAATSDGRWPW